MQRSPTLWFGKKPKLSFLKVWGCDAYVKKLQPDKLEPKSEKCVFIGYPKETVGYTFYHRSVGKIFVAKNGSIGVLETGVPRLACLRPTTWLCERARMAHLHQQALKTLARGPSLVRRTTQDLLRSGLTRLAHEGQRVQGKANLARFQ